MYVQTINILIVNQSVIDMCASFFTLMVVVVEVDGTRMSRDSAYDQFICRVWLTRLPLWALLANSTYGIVLIALERYVAVIYPLWYNVRINDRFLQFPIGKTETYCIYLVALKQKHTYRVRKNQPIYACLQSLRPHMRMRSYILLRLFLFRTPFSEVTVRNSIKWANLIVQKLVGGGRPLQRYRVSSRDRRYTANVQGQKSMSQGQKSRSQCKVMYQQQKRYNMAMDTFSEYRDSKLGMAS